MTDAVFIAQRLKQQGVTKVFGQCGHTNYALIDACHRLGIEYISFRHEQMAAHAPKLAVVNVHLLPGVTKKSAPRGDVPMPRTGYWDIADFLKKGNGPPAEAAPARDEILLTE